MCSKNIIWALSHTEHARDQGTRQEEESYQKSINNVFVLWTIHAKKRTFHMHAHWAHALWM